MTAKHSEKFLVGVPAETVDEGINRQILGYDPSIMMCRAAFETGAVGNVHSHPHAQVTYVESGQFDVEIDGEHRLMGPGDGFYVPPHAKHGAVCKEAGALIDVFSPVREDFFETDGGKY